MKRIIIAAILSLVITLLGLGVNYYSYQNNRSLLLAWRSHGGEITAEHGFGLRAIHIYPMMEGETATHSLSFSPVSFLFAFVFLTVFIWLLLFCAEKLMTGRGKKRTS
ncbi:MAG: hypothetical protein IKS32_07505 [Solobacterium sp.]|nr:hypothetical protein [Solobacterium sp.]